MCVRLLVLALCWAQKYSFYEEGTDIFSKCEDILAGPHKLKGLFQGYDLVLRLGLQMGLD